MEVQFYPLKNSKETVVLSWESLAKTAAYIAKSYYRSFG